MSLRFDPTRTPDVVVLGAGLIGLAIALELKDRGAQVTVIDRDQSLAGASTAAAGMLAADDPSNPPELRELSRLSAEYYPAFLGRLEALSGIAVPFQTNTTLQYLEGGSTLRLAEYSLDPRQLAATLRAAVMATSIRLLEHTQIVSTHQTSDGATIELSGGRPIAAQAIVYAAGAWTTEVMAALGGDPISVTPYKGQMLRVRLPFPLDEVHRNEQIYICPRTRGPQAGTALIGATVEDIGFDTSVRADALAELRALAAKLLPPVRLRGRSSHGRILGRLPPRHSGQATHNGRMFPSRAIRRDRTLPQWHPAGARHGLGHSRPARRKGASHRGFGAVATALCLLHHHIKIELPAPIDIRANLSVTTRSALPDNRRVLYKHEVFRRAAPMSTVAPKGLQDVIANDSSICFIDGAKGILSYRGIDIHELAQKSYFEETTFLLWNGSLPTAAELNDFSHQLAAARQLPDDVIDFLTRLPKTASPMEVLRTAVSLLSIYDP